MVYEEVRAIVDRAAELLPEPPIPGMAGVYGSWEALVTGTGRRLAHLLGTDIDLIKRLIADERSAPAQYRQRRKVLLGLTMLAALELRLGKSPVNPLQCRLDVA
jgi:hypothetical protein